MRPKCQKGAAKRRHPVAIDEDYSQGNTGKRAQATKALLDTKVNNGILGWLIKRLINSFPIPFKAKNAASSMPT